MSDRRAIGLNNKNKTRRYDIIHSERNKDGNPRLCAQVEGEGNAFGLGHHCKSAVPNNIFRVAVMWD